MIAFGIFLLPSLIIKIIPINSLFDKGILDVLPLSSSIILDVSIGTIPIVLFYDSIFSSFLISGLSSISNLLNKI